MFDTGKLYNRSKDIHGVYGGQRQGGMSTPKKFPYIFLFTGQTGEQYGYADGWDPDGVFIYTGEGQVGDMGFVRSNLAVRDHVPDGKELHLFEFFRKGLYRYIGRFSCVTWEYRQGPDKNGKARRTIVFHLIKQDADDAPIEISKTDLKLPLDKLRQRAYSAASPAVQAREKESKGKYYERSKDVKIYVIARADGVCELCKNNAPFSRKDDSPYLEAHHTRRVSDEGPDHPRWVGAICPNCHREIHYGRDGKTKNMRLEDILGEMEKA